MNILNKAHKIQGLYIHIPFCVKKCHYCDFAVVAQGSNPQTHNPLQTRYLQALEKELALYTNAKQLDFSQMETIYIGGGTPSLLTEQNLITLSSMLNSSFGGNFQQKLKELTIECEPGTISKSKIATIME